MISSAIPGSRIEPWVAKEAFEESAYFQGQKIDGEPAKFYEPMIRPLEPLAMKGFLWYQGESNASQPKQYAQYLPALINDWRKQWQQPLLPFLYVQLPGFMEYDYLPAESNWAILRESQAKALALPQTVKNH